MAKTRIKRVRSASGKTGSSSLRKGRGRVARKTWRLPVNPKAIVEAFNRYVTLIYGREKIGKTTLASQFPGAIFAAFEPGVKRLQVHEFFEENEGAPSWEAFKGLVSLLVEQGVHDSPFDTVVVDTVDMAYVMCLNWVCQKLRIDYPGTSSDGGEDFGKSWAAVRTEFTEVFYQLANAGFGILFISHAKEELVESRTGNKYTRIFPSMSAQGRKVVEAMADFFFYADYYNTEDGGTNRVLVCRGDEIIWAGARGGLQSTFPDFLPLLKEGGYEVIEAAFTGEYAGLKLSELRANKLTTKAGATFLKRQATGRAVATRRSPKKTGTRRVSKKKKVRRTTQD